MPLDRGDIGVRTLYFSLRAPAADVASSAHRIMIYIVILLDDVTIIAYTIY